MTFEGQDGSVTTRTYTGFARHKADAICDAMEYFEKGGLPLGYGHIEAKAF
jgi:hypothetical protein